MKNRLLSRRRCNGLLLGLVSLSFVGHRAATAQASPIPLDVYKDPTCGCCGLWIEHMAAAGFASTVHHPDDLNRVKQELGIPPQLQSCHTAVTAEGYRFEGHVPARFVQQFLAAPPPNSAGLLVPGMPLGSPGMEVGERFTPYDVLLLNRDGSTSVYASLGSAAEQF
ncbi:MAG: hypothetical protein RLZZ385_1544 [Pseudomonadota bacterium]